MPDASPQVALDTRATPSAGAPASAAPPAWAASAASAAAAKPPTGPFANDSAAELLRKVQLGLGGGSAREAQEAASVLQFCAHAAKSAESLPSARDTLSLMPKFILKFIDALGGISDEQVAQAQADARRCQVFDEATLARRGEMFQKAYEGGAPNAAMPYLTWLVSDGQAEADPAVVEKLQADVRQLAQAGDFGTLMAFAFMVDSQPYGASRTEREAYKEAWLRIAGEGNPGNAASSRVLIDNLERFSRVAPLTAEQQQEAQALAQQVYDAYRRSLNQGG
ncbi:MAG: hypothetical protein ACOZJX_21240 [Pseudomonadota bacterium]